MIPRVIFLLVWLCWLGSLHATGPIISEFLALNQTSLRDANGDSSDWIELVNASDTATNLLGWHLTDDATHPAKWTFPGTPLGPGEFLVVFASGKNRAVAGLELHTNFRLSNEGEYLALTRPDNSIASGFAPVFPPQGPDIAYGMGLSTMVSLNPVPEGAACRYWVPTNADLGDTWTRPDFDSSSWLSGAAPLGFDTAGVFRRYADEILADDPVYYWNFDEASGPALNQANPGVVQDSLTAQGAAVRLTHGSLPLGRAASFPGTDGSRFYTANLSAGADLVGPWAVEFWARNRSPAKPTYFLEGASAGGSFNTPSLIEGYNGARLEIFGPGGRTGVDGPLLTDTNWHHLVFGYFGSGAGEGVASRHDIYVDGVRMSSQLNDFSNALAFGGGGLGVGGTQAGLGQSVLNGQMDELAVYDLRAQTTADAVAARLAALATHHYLAALTTNFGSALATDLRAAMAGRAASLYVRHEFALSNAVGWNQVALRVKYVDGFVAWLNGTRVASANAPDPVAFDSTAPTNRPPAEGARYQTFDLSPIANLLVSGSNVLALQGLVNSVSDPQFLLSAELTVTGTRAEVGYLTPPTPGQPNGVVRQRIGPSLSDVTESPARPLAGRDFAITARVGATLAAIRDVQLLWRVMYSNEVTAPMRDDGVPPDAVAGDGLFTAAIPGRAFTNGQMIRWAVVATDTSGETTREPAFLAPTASPQYFGTVAAQPAATSNIPILDWFVAPGTEAAARSLTGTRAALFYEAEFYDNVWVHLRGRTAAGLDKNPYEFGFNPGHQFRFDPGQPRVDQFALNTTYRDKAYVRPVLGFGLFRDAGVPASCCFPLHVRRNNQFFSVALFCEILDRDFLRRNGLDPNGALYKADLNGFTVEAQGGYLPAAQGFEKKTPDDANFSDIIAFAQGLAQTGDARTRYVFDYVDLPATVNYLALCVIIQDGDRLVTNFYPYRDTFGTGEWTMLPWDLDLSLGQYNNSTDELWHSTDYPAGDCHPFLRDADDAGLPEPSAVEQAH